MSSTSDFLRASFCNLHRVGVWSPVGSADTLGELVGSLDGDAVGFDDGLLDGDALGETEGDALGLSVGRADGVIEGFDEGEALG